MKVLKEETPSFLKMSGQKFEKKLIFLHSFTYFFQNWGAQVPLHKLSNSQIFMGAMTLITRKKLNFCFLSLFNPLRSAYRKSCHTPIIYKPNVVLGEYVKIIIRNSNFFSRKLKIFQGLSYTTFNFQINRFREYMLSSQNLITLPKDVKLHLICH